MKKLFTFMLILFSITAQAQELNDNAQLIKQLSGNESKMYLVREGYTALNQFIQDKYPDDYSMQVYEMNKQADAFVDFQSKLVGYAKDDRKTEEFKMLYMAFSKWGGKLTDEGDLSPYGVDFRMVIYSFEKNLKAYLAIKGN